jgi:hypothetical protein
MANASHLRDLAARLLAMATDAHDKGEFEPAQMLTVRANRVIESAEAQERSQDRVRIAHPPQQQPAQQQQPQPQPKKHDD